MATDNRTRAALLSEIETLRLRLEEAEETLHAINSGEVDALIVASPKGNQIFTLQGPEHPYRVLVETMNEGSCFPHLERQDRLLQQTTGDHAASSDGKAHRLPVG